MHYIMRRNQLAIGDSLMELQVQNNKHGQWHLELYEQDKFEDFLPLQLIDDLRVDVNRAEIQPNLPNKYTI